MKKTIVVLVCISLTAALAAQVFPGASSARGFVSTGLSFQKWSYDLEGAKPVQEAVFPVTAFVPLNPSFFLTVSNTPGTAKSDTVSLSGLSDSWIRGTYVFPSQRVMLTAGIGAPTGKSRLKPDEFMLSQDLGMNVFRFRLPVFGQGLSTKVGAAVALPMQKNAVFGAGIHYIARSKFKPIDGSEMEYQAGNETSLYAGFDVQLNAKAKWSFNLGYTLYGKDKLNDTTVFASGKKLLLNTSLSAQVGKGLLSASLLWRQRGKNEYWIGTSLKTEPKNSNGAQTEIDAAYRIPSGPKTVLSLLGTGRFYQKNEYDLGGANVLGGGAGVQVVLSPKVTLQCDVLVLTGKHLAPVKIDLSGLDLSAGLVFGL